MCRCEVDDLTCDQWICPLFQLTAQQLIQTVSSPRQPMIPIDISWRSGAAQKRASDFTIETDDGFGSVTICSDIYKDKVMIRCTVDSLF